MAELSNAVTVLIARMESHPEDFELYTTRRGKFSGTAESLYGLAGLREDKHQAFWFLPDADKEALIAAWKKYHLTKFEKDVMETIFDDGEGERELAKANQQLYQAQQRAMIQNAMMNSQMPQPVSALNAAQNSTGNAGLLGSAGTALKGFFG